MNKGAEISIILIILFIIIVAIGVGVFFYIRSRPVTILLSKTGQNTKDPIVKDGGNVIYLDQTIKKNGHTLTLSKDGLIYSSGSKSVKLTDKSGKFAILASDGVLRLFSKEEDYQNDEIALWFSDSDSKCIPKSECKGPYSLVGTSKNIIIKGVENSKPCDVCVWNF